MNGFQKQARCNPKVKLPPANIVNDYYMFIQDVTTNARVLAVALKCVERKKNQLNILKTDDKIDARGETTTNIVF